ncbi:MAG: rod shape-determining protein [Veillonella sp.]
MSSILPTLGKDVSIDIGSIQTRLMGGTRGTVISEPSIIATDTKQEKVVAVGDEAARLVLRMPDMWRPLTPLKDGFIVDYRVMHTMLSYFLNKVSNALRRARVVVGVPCGMTDVEQRAMMDAVIQAGASRGIPHRTTCGCCHWLRCALSLKLQGSMVIDIGGGTVDMGIVSLGGIVDSKTIRFGGSDINNALLRYVRECFGVIVSDETIVDIKHTVGTAIAPLEDAEYAFQGRDMMNGLGRRCVIHQSEVYQVVNDCIDRPLR